MIRSVEAAGNARRVCGSLGLALSVLFFGTAHAADPRAPASAHSSSSAPSRPNAAAQRANQAARAAAAGYAQSVKGWHAPATMTVGKDAQGRALLSLTAINTREHLDLPALTDDGGFSASDLDRAARFLRDPRTSAMHPIEPKMLSRIYRLQRHFDVAELRVISGYRLPKPGGRSNHGRGRAMDLVVPGITDEDVAKYARDLGYGGVGIYPTSGFVHVDVRDHSYFWVDTSGPGAKRRERGILPDLASRADDAAKKRGESPVRPYRVLLDVDAAGPGPMTDDGGSDHDDEDDSTL